VPTSQLCSEANVSYFAYIGPVSRTSFSDFFSSRVSTLIDSFTQKLSGTQNLDTSVRFKVEQVAIA
jgi:hypothetical protein